MFYPCIVKWILYQVGAGLQAMDAWCRHLRSAEHVVPPQEDREGVWVETVATGQRRNDYMCHW